MDKDSQFPLVSIGIPTYNGSRTIAKAISSVLAQSYPNIELIVSDNASADPTEDICESFQKRDPRIKIIRQSKNISVTANFAHVFKASCGDFFMWLADDEWLADDYITKCLDVLVKNEDYGLVAGRSVYHYENGASQEGEIISLEQDDVCQRINSYYENVLYNGIFYGVYRKSVLEKVTLNSMYAGDRLLVDHICRQSKVKMVDDTFIHKKLKRDYANIYAFRFDSITIIEKLFPNMVFSLRVFIDIYRKKIYITPISRAKRLFCASKSLFILVKRFIKYDLLNFQDKLKIVLHVIKEEMLLWLRQFIFLFKSIVGLCLNCLNSNDERKNVEYLAFFSPIHPVKSGISSYSTHLLDELKKYYNIDVFVDCHYGKIPKGENGYKVYGYLLFRILKAIRRYECLVYQVGSSVYHNYMYHTIKKIGGIVVLHDGMNFPYMKDKVALLRRSDIIVHNKTSYNDVHDRGLKGRIIEIPLIMPQTLSWDELEYEKKKLRHTIGISEDVLVIGAFGIISPAKHVISALAAASELFSNEDKFLFIVAGYSILDEQVVSFFESYKDDKRYILEANLTSEEFNKCIMVTDICFNLRYPFYGETSAALLKIMSYGVASIVTDIGSFRDLPDNSVIKTSTGIVINEYKDILSKSKFDKEWINKIGKNAYTYIKENHNPKVVCNRYLDFMGHSC